MPISPPPPGAILRSWCIVATTPVAKMFDQFKSISLTKKMNSLFTLVIEFSGKLGEWTYQSVAEYIYCWISGNRQLGHWQEGWCFRKKKKELIRHIKTITKDMEFVQSYHQRAETSIAIAMRMNSSFYIDTTRPLSSSVVFGELPLSSVLLLYKLQQSSELSL